MGQSVIPGNEKLMRSLAQEVNTSIVVLNQQLGYQNLRSSFDSMIQHIQPTVSDGWPVQSLITLPNNIHTMGLNDSAMCVSNVERPKHSFTLLQCAQHAADIDQSE